MKKYSQNHACYSTKIKDNFIILNTESGLYHELNDTGSAIWEIIKEKKCINDIVAMLIKNHMIDRETCNLDVTTFIEDCINKNIVIENRE